ncbi:M16 family metallopeptidase [Sulfurimonas sp.]
MKHLSFLIFFFFATTTLLADTTVDPYKNIQYFELNNGLKVYLLHDAQAVNTQIELKVNVGTSVETVKNAGISHLLEHLIFRDQRVPHNDYLDYFKEEGATFVNGYTSKNSTRYLTTISSDKSYFIAKEFAQMIFDKNVTKEDLKVEKKALQVEVGDIKWYHKIAYYMASVLRPLSLSFPDKPDIFIDSFELEKDKKNIPSYISKFNNTNFTLEELMRHYKEYYYPKNMTLKIVGNFDEKRMKELIEKEYAKVTRTGTKRSHELAYNAKLQKKKFIYFTSALSDKNVAYIGTRYLLNDYKQYLTMLAYSEYLSSKMQQTLRNKLGQTYTVSPYNTSKRDAALSGIIFESLHDDFDENLRLIQKQLLGDINKMSNKEIQEALKQSKLYYTSLEHDSETLMNLVDTQEYLHLYQNIYDKTPYEIFNSITPEYFQSEITQSFADVYRYLYIYRDYYFFPFDMLVISMLMFFAIILLFKKASKLQLARLGVTYKERDVVLSQRVTGYFITTVVFIIIFLLSAYIDDWLNYYIFLLFFDNAKYMYTLSQPLNYIYEILDFILFLAIYIFVSLTLFRGFYTKVELTNEKLYLLGLSVLVIDKSEIQEIKSVPWSLSKYFKTCGVSVVFFRRLVEVRYGESKVIYLRVKEPQEFVEDLNIWLKK